MPNQPINSLPSDNGLATPSDSTAVLPGSDFYEFALEVAADEVFLLDKDARLVYVNQLACERLGYSREELIGKQVWEWDPLFSKEVWYANFPKLVEQKSQFFETEHCSKTGEIFPVEIRSRYYEHNGQGYALAFVTDLSDRKKTEQNLESKSNQLDDLAKRTQRYQDALTSLTNREISSLDETFRHICATTASAMDIARVSIWVIDQNKQEMQCVELFDNQAGHSSGMILQHQDYPVYFNALNEGRRLIIEDAEQDKAMLEFTDNYLKPNKIASLLDIPLFYDQELIGVVCHEHTGEIRHWQPHEIDFASTIGNFVSLAIEINKRKKIENRLEETVLLRTREAVEANQAKSHLLANVSHELRTPMHSIISFSGLALKKAEDPKLKSYLEKINISAKRLTQMVDDLLDLSKLESGNTEIEYQLYDVHQLLQQAIDEVTALIDEKQIDIQIKVRAGLSAELDPKLVIQVLINLLSNAIKFSPASSCIEIAAEKITLPGKPEMIEFSVIDEGPGIPPDQLKSIFERYLQSSLNSNKKSGTGLGLAISSEIVDLHHGKIRAESPPENRDKGSAMIFTLPVSPDQVQAQNSNLIIWKSEYSVGNYKFDKQHKKIIQLINRLSETTENLSAHNREIFRKILQDLYIYINEHLVEEEFFLSSNGYPDFAQHKALHDYFRKHISELSANLDKEDDAIYSKLFMFLRHWFFNHILEEDMKYKRHYDLD
jgi:hemerythrin-like metal-binding protein/PAS domain S-box-containing protein